MTVKSLIAGTILGALATSALIEFGPRPQVVERIEGRVRYVETVNSRGIKSGMQRIYVGDTLSAERMFDMGELVSSTEYWPDGSVKSYREVE